MTHAEPHFNFGLGNYKSCICTCSDCFDIGPLCLCIGCSCHDKTQKLHTHYPSPQPLKVKDVVIELPEHPCKKCGREVVRVGSRGRWPSLCPGCR